MKKATTTPTVQRKASKKAVQARTKNVMRKRATTATQPAPAEQAPSKATKKDTVLGLLQRDEGATLQALMAATGWQAHSVRGFISGTLRKKLRLTVAASKNQAGEHTYRVAP